MNVSDSRNRDVNGRLDRPPPDARRSLSPTCGIMWLIVGGSIVALSILGLGRLPLREVLVYGAQGVMVSLYGCYRLRLARPASVDERLKRGDGVPSRVHAAMTPGWTWVGRPRTFRWLSRDSPQRSGRAALPAG